MGMLEDALREYAKFVDRTTDPTTPGTDEALVYVKDGTIHSVDDAGTVTEYGSGGGGIAEAAKATRQSSTQSISNSTDTPIEFDTAIYDDNSILDIGGTNPSRLTVQTAGRYSIRGGMRFESGMTGAISLRIRKNGTDILADTITHGDVDSFGRGIVICDDVSVVGDYYEIIARQATGSAKSLAADQRNWGAIARVS